MSQLYTQTQFYSTKLLHFILTYSKYHFKLDMLEPNVLMGPWFYTKVSQFDQELKGELCNFLYLDQPEITIENLKHIEGQIVLYQYPSKFDAEYHLKFIRILSINDDNIILSSDFTNQNNILSEKIINLRQRSSAYRIWVPTQLYIEKIVDIII